MIPLAVLPVIVLILLSASSVATAQEKPQVAGKWTGTIVSGPYTSLLEMGLDEKDGVVTGTHSIQHAIGGRTTTGWVKGTIKGRKIKLNTEHAYFDLRLSDDNKLMKGDGQSSVYFQVEVKRQD